MRALFLIALFVFASIVVRVAADPSPPPASDKLAKHLGKAVVDLIPWIESAEAFRCIDQGADPDAKKVGLRPVRGEGKPLTKEQTARLTAILLADDTYFRADSKGTTTAIAFCAKTKGGETIELSACVVKGNLQILVTDSAGKVLKSGDVRGFRDDKQAPIRALAAELFPDDPQVQKYKPTAASAPVSNPADPVKPAPKPEAKTKTDANAETLKPDRLRIRTNVGDGAEVITATFLGGKGHEWLCGGGFAPDGAVILAGNILGPNLDWSVPANVIGNDRPAPPNAQRVPEMEKGKQKLDKQGQPIWEKPSWRHDGVTAFVVHCSADMKKVIAVHRFPWAAGAATAAVVSPSGDIYIAGKAADGLANLTSDNEELAADKNESREKGPCERAFLAKLAKDGAKAVWVRHVRGPTASPTVSLSSDGKQVLFGAGSLYALDPGGKCLSQVTLPDGLKTTSSVNPSDGSIAVGGEHHWPTGREPWRCPTLNVYSPDGKLRRQFYDWGGPYVGLDNCRQVSDSAIRFLTHDPDGGLVFYAWSDGGNSVMTSEPFDVRSPVWPKGLGMSAAGAGVLSCAYLVRLDPLDNRVVAWTFWSSTSSNGKPNSIWIQTLSRVPGGPLAMAGRGASAVWQTPNKLSDAEPSGEYIAVLSEDFSTLRFSSVLPATGIAQVTDGAAGRGCQWGIASGIVNGKTRVLFVGSALAGREENGAMVPAPTKAPVQNEFGGGWCDGYAVLIELPPSTAKPPTFDATQPGATSASFELAARSKDPKKPSPVPTEGTTFHFNPVNPKYVTVDVEIRDQSCKLRPIFFYGKPVDGALIYRAKGPEAKFNVACPSLCQPFGDQDGRVLGEWVKDANRPPVVSFSLETLGDAKSINVNSMEKGLVKTRTIEYFEAAGTLDVDGHKVKVSPRVTLAYSGPKTGDIDTVRASAFITLSAKDLGLAAVAPDTLLDLRLSMSGNTISDRPKPKK